MVCESCNGTHNTTLCCCALPSRCIPSTSTPGVTFFVCGKFHEHYEQRIKGPCQHRPYVTYEPTIQPEFPIYDFWIEWAFRRYYCDVKAKVVSLPCPGLYHHTWYALFSKRGIGTMTMQQLSRINVTQYGMPVLHNMLSSIRGVHNQNAFLGQNHVPLLIGGHSCLRSPFCEGRTNTPSEPCRTCFDAKQYMRLNDIANSVTDRMLGMHEEIRLNDGVLNINHFQTTRNDVLCEVELRAKLDSFTKTNKIQAKHHTRTKHRLQGIQQAHMLLKDEFHRASSTTSLLAFVQNFSKANDDGVFDNHVSIKYMMESMVDAMKVNNLKGRKIGEEVKQFYAELLIHGGPQLHDYVSRAFMGPHLSTTRNFLNEFRTGTFYKWEAKRFTTATNILGKFGLKDAPCILAEDGTAIVPHLDVILHKDHIVLLGTLDGAIEFHTIEDVQAFSSSNTSAPSFATTFHLYMLIPLVDGAPAIPVVAKLMDSTKGTYNARVVQSAWRDAFSYLKGQGVQLVGHSGDGASPFRSTSLLYMLRKAHPTEHAILPTMNAITFNHPLVQLILPCMNNDHPIFAAPDWLHILFRLRRQFLDPKRRLMLFHCGCFHSKLVTWELLKPSNETLGLRANDTNYSDKQNMAACLRFGGIQVIQKDGVASINTNIIDRLRGDGDHLGVFLYMTFFHVFTRIFLIKDRLPSDVLRDCGWCLAFLGYWDMSVTHSKGRDGKYRYNKKVNFLTLETKTDIIVLLNVVILAIRWFSIKYPNVKFLPHRMSTKDVEHQFKELRFRMHNNDNRITAMSGMYVCEVGQGLLQLQSNGVDRLSYFKPKRSVKGKDGMDKVDHEWNKMPNDYYPNLDEQVKLVDTGATDLTKLLKQEVSRDGSATRFAPWSSLPSKNNHLDLVANGHLLKVPEQVSNDWRELFFVNMQSTSDNITQPPMGNNANDGVRSNDNTNIDDEYDHDNDEECYFQNYDNNHGFEVGSDGDDLSINDIEMSSMQSKHGSKRRGMHKHVYEKEQALKTKSLMEEAIKTQQQVAVQQVAHVFDAWAKEVNDIHDVSNELEGRDKLKAMEHKLRSLVRRYNGIHKPRQDTRQGARFHAMELADRSIWVTNEDVYEDEDCVAVMCDEEGKGPQVWYASVEKCFRKQGKIVTNCHALHHMDQEGVLVIQYFEPLMVGRKGARAQARVDGMLQFNLPIASSYSMNETVTADNVIAIVAMSIPTLPNGRKASYWVLPIEEENIVNQLFKELLQAKSNIQQ